MSLPIEMKEELYNELVNNTKYDIDLFITCIYKTIIGNPFGDYIEQSTDDMLSECTYLNTKYQNKIHFDLPKMLNYIFYNNLEIILFENMKSLNNDNLIILSGILYKYIVDETNYYNKNSIVEYASASNYINDYRSFSIIFKVNNNSSYSKVDLFNIQKNDVIKDISDLYVTIENNILFLKDDASNIFKEAQLPSEFSNELLSISIEYIEGNITIVINDQNILELNINNATGIDINPTLLIKMINIDVNTTAPILKCDYISDVYNLGRYSMGLFITKQLDSVSNSKKIMMNTMNLLIKYNDNVFSSFEKTMSVASYDGLDNVKTRYSGQTQEEKQRKLRLAQEKRDRKKLRKQK